MPYSLWLGPVAGVFMKEPMDIWDIWPGYRGAAPGNPFLSQDIVGRTFYGICSIPP